MRNVTAKTNTATRCRSDGACENAVLVGFEERVLSMVVAPITIFADAVGQGFAKFDEHAATHYSVAPGTVKGDENWSPVFVEL